MASILSRAERRKQQKLQSRKLKKIDRNAIARYMGTALDLNLTKQLQDCFVPIIAFLKAMIAGEGVSVNSKGYPILDQDGSIDEDDQASGGINLVLEMVWQCLYLQGNPCDDFQKALLIINRKLSKKLDYGCPIELKDSQFALQVVVIAHEWIITSANHDIVREVLTRIKEAHRNCVISDRNFTVERCRDWLYGDQENLT